MKQTLKNRRGMTLIELLIGMLILSIIVTTVSVIMTPTLRAYYSANELAEVNALFDSLSADLLYDISRAESLSVSGETLTIGTRTGTVVYGVNTEGLLYRDTESNPLLSAPFYKNKKLEVEYLNPADDSGLSGSLPKVFKVRLTLSRTDTSERLASRDYVAAPIGMQ